MNKQTSSLPESFRMPIMSIPQIAIIPVSDNSSVNSEATRPFSPEPLFLLAARYAVEEGFTPLVCTNNKNITEICHKENIQSFLINGEEAATPDGITKVLDSIHALVFAVLNPVSPFRKRGLLRKMLDSINKGNSSSCLTVRKVKFIGFSGNDYYENYDENSNTPGYFYYFDDNITVTSTASFRRSRKIFNEQSLAFINTFPYCLKIESETEFKVLKHLLSMDESVCWLPGI